MIERVIGSVGIDGDADNGTCCVCSKRVHVHSVFLLGFKCPIPGRGWGCRVCGLPEDGAIAVVCDECIGTYVNPLHHLRFICSGRPGLDGRTPLSQVGGHHVHDLTKHVARDGGF